MGFGTKYYNLGLQLFKACAWGYRSLNTKDCGFAWLDLPAMKLLGLVSLWVWPGGVSLGSLGLMCKCRIKSEGSKVRESALKILFGLILLFLKLLESQKVSWKDRRGLGGGLLIPFSPLHYWWESWYLEQWFLNQCLKKILNMQYLTT